MIKKFSKYVNSLVVLIKKLIPAEKSLVSENPIVQKSYEKITKKYAEAFKKLSKN